MAHRLADDAEFDLDEIWLYIAEESGNSEIADRFVRSLSENFYLLAVNPHIGRRRDELREGVRSFPSGEYLIFYRIAQKDVLILRVLRGSRISNDSFERIINAYSPRQT